MGLLRWPGVRWSIVAAILVLFTQPAAYAGTASLKKQSSMKKSPEHAQESPKAKQAAPVIKKKKKMKCENLHLKIPSNLPDANVNILYEHVIKTSGGVNPLVVEKTPNSVLPELKVNKKGVLTGTPTKAGSYRFKIKVSDACSPVQSVEKTVKLNVHPQDKVNISKKRTDPMSKKAGSSKIIIGTTSAKGMSQRKSSAAPTKAKTPNTSLKKEKKIGVMTKAPVTGPKTKPLPVTGQVALSKAGPQIESLFTAPIGALRPLTKLYLKGKYFGTQPGKIILYSDTNGSINLQNVEWKNEENVNGVVPASTEKWPHQTLMVKIKTADNRLSGPVKIGFGAREEAWLEMEDVIVEKCGRDGNMNACNHVFGGSCTGEHCQIDTGEADEYRTFAIRGYHCNNWGTVGDDYGVDRYRIHLKNGWVIKSTDFRKNASSWNEVYLEGPGPRIPVGKSDVSFEFAWEVSPDDSVCYGLRVKLEGPAGTYYK